ncbi:MAG: hypothetical protein FJ267_05625 [Planctomycetes bacterium]|nr:hypothetical protein [Planctomycetota bacterium]
MIEQLLFSVFAFLVCGGAIAVVLSQNVVRMAFWLVVSLGSVAALFFLLHADFLGAAQLLIYVGGTVVLLVFGVMLTASAPTVQIKTSPAETFLGAGVGLLLLFVLSFAISAVDWSGVEQKIGASAKSPQAMDAAVASNSAIEDQRQGGRTVRQLGLGFLGLRPDRDLGQDHSAGLAPGYLLPFEIVSVHLLVVLVGAAYLARAKRRVDQKSVG